MKPLPLLATAALALLAAGCSTYVERTPTAVVASPAIVAAAPVQVFPMTDSDGDGVLDAYDRYPFDRNWR